MKTKIMHTLYSILFFGYTVATVYQVLFPREQAFSDSSGLSIIHPILLNLYFGICILHLILAFFIRGWSKYLWFFGFVLYPFLSLSVLSYFYTLKDGIIGVWVLELLVYFGVSVVFWLQKRADKNKI